MDSDGQLVEQGVVVEGTTPKVNWVRVRYSFGTNTFEGEGAIDEINRHVEAFLTIIQQNKTSLLDSMPFSAPQASPEGEKSEPLSANNDSLQATLLSVQNKLSLLELYLKSAWDATAGKSTIKQPQQILLITYYQVKYKAATQVCPDDYEQAYAELSNLPVNAPGNLSARLSELVHDGYLKKVDRGCYSLTYKGEQAVAKLLAGK